MNPQLFTHHQPFLYNDYFFQQRHDENVAFLAYLGHCRDFAIYGHSFDRYIVTLELIGNSREVFVYDRADADSTCLDRLLVDSRFLFDEGNGGFGSLRVAHGSTRVWIRAST